jgi:VWFA-related protein
MNGVALSPPPNRRHQHKSSNRPTNTNLHPTPSRRTPLALIARNVTSLLALLCTLSALAQTQQPASSPNTPTESPINAVVHDRNGNPVQALKPEGFSLKENGKPLPITHVEERTAATPSQPPGTPDLPPGIFTNYTPAAPDGTLNILLLDSLNIPPNSQAFILHQLKQWVEQPHALTQLAIFGLASHLVVLQSFSTDPTILKDAVEHKLIPRGSDPAHDAVATRDVELMQAAANLQQFEVAMKSTDRQFRTQATLDAFNTLAHDLAALPGRKNILWLSSSFPLNLTANSQQPASEEARQTADLLNTAQVSIYPIDARGLISQPQSAVNTAKFDDTAAAEHTAMEQLAHDTGGAAIDNPTTLAQAVDKAIQTGDNFYTLTYAAPQTDTSRSIRVALSTTNSELTYPKDYAAALPPAPPAAPTNAPAPTESAYAHAALARGAPTPADILFKVRVLPASTTTDPTIAPGNVQDPSYIIPGPWQRYDIDFAALANAFTLPLGTDGKHTGHIAALVYVYDTDGRTLNSEGKGVTVTLTPDQYKQLATSSINFHFVVSVPVRQESYLRLALHDIDSDRFGVIEVPASAVSRLPPPPASPTEPAPATAQH